jgi:hypothetical protein
MSARAQISPAEAGEKQYSRSRGFRNKEAEASLKKDMSALHPAAHDQGISLRQAALLAGLGLMIMTIAAPFAEFFVYSKLVVRGDIEATVQNMQAHGGLLLAGIFAYLITFIMDLVVAWALYVLLIPVNQPVSLLTAWFRVVYTAIALFAMLKLVSVYRLLSPADDQMMLGPDQLLIQVDGLLDAFRYEWGVGLILFGIHLLMLGWLVYRSSYIPRVLGILLVVAGAGWVVYELGPYLLPNANLEFLMITFFGELVFMLWLLFRGWKIPAQSNSKAPG